MKKDAVFVCLFLILVVCACSPKNSKGKTPIIPTSTHIYTSSTTTPNPQPSFPSKPTTAPSIINFNEYLQATESNLDCWGKDRFTSISANAVWCSVGYHFPESQKVLIKNKNGFTWQIPLDKFMAPEEMGGEGNIIPFYWSNDGRFLYITTYLGWDGGGTQCFNPGNGDGLYRFNLESGDLDTIIGPSWGHLFAFSSMDRYLATDLNGVSLIDFQYNQTIHLNSTKPQSFYWSPDGRYLAYSVATCGIEKDNIFDDDDWWNVASSSAYIYDTQTGQTTVMLRSDKQLLMVESWSDNSKVEISGEQYLGTEDIRKNYLFNINSKTYTFIGTATPTP